MNRTGKNIYTQVWYGQYVPFGKASLQIRPVGTHVNKITHSTNIMPVNSKLFWKDLVGLTACHESVDIFVHAGRGCSNF